LHDVWDCFYCSALVDCFLCLAGCHPSLWPFFFWPHQPLQKPKQPKQPTTGHATMCGMNCNAPTPSTTTIAMLLPPPMPIDDANMPPMPPVLMSLPPPQVDYCVYVSFLPSMIVTIWQQQLFQKSMHCISLLWQCSGPVLFPDVFQLSGGLFGYAVEGKFQCFL